MTRTSDRFPERPGGFPSVRSCARLILVGIALCAGMTCEVTAQQTEAHSSQAGQQTEISARYLGALETARATADPGLARTMAVTATPPAPPILSFNPAAIGVDAAAAQQLTASFSVSGYSGSFIPTAILHYGHDYKIGAVTCTAGGASETCNAAVTFQPSLPGARKDAIFLMDGTTRLATVLLNGVGQGPLSLLQPGAFSTSVPSSSLNTSGFNYLYQSVADENGIVYILPSGNAKFIVSVTKAGVATPIPLTNPPYFWSIGIDGAGVLYIFGESTTVTTYDTLQGIQGTYQIPYAGPDTSWYPGVLSEDGTIYIVDQIHNNGTAYAFNPDGSTLYADTLNPGVLQPNTAAVDSDGDLFVGGYTINKITPAGVQTQVNTVGASEGLAVDAADTLYATRYNPTDGVAELSKSDYSTPIASFGRSSPLGMSLGSDGTLYISNYINLDIYDRSTAETIDFGEVDAGKSSTLSTASIYNGGNEPLTISGFTLSELSDAGFSLDFSSANECTFGIVLAPGALCQVSVVFAPTHPGTFSGTISVSSNSLNNPLATQSIQLTGTTYGSYDVVTPNPLVFPSQAPGTSKTLAVTLTNNGNFYASTIYSVATDNPAFTIAQGTCAGVAVQVGASCQLQVTFSPTAAQAYSGNAIIVTYVSGTAQESQTIALPLSGTETAPPPVASLSPASLSFTAAAGTISAAQTVTLSNTGQAPLTINGIVAGSSPLAGLFNETSNCGASLAAGASCAISVTFSPATTGSVTGTLLVTDNAVGSPQTVTLSGAGTAAPVPVASLSPSSLSFSATAGTTSAAQTLTLSNTGKAPLNITGIVAESSPLAGLFNETSNCGASLAAEASCSISITFSPVVAGSVTGTLLVTDNAAGSPQPVTLSGAGTATPVPVASLSPSSLSFSATAGTTSAAQTVTLSNTGKAPLNIIGIVAESSPLAGLFNETSNCGASLAAGASCAISVSFSPVTTGSITGTLLVTDNAAGSPQTVNLSGTGTAAPLPVTSLSPSSLTFSATAGTTSAAQTVTLSNTGKAPLTISGISAPSSPLAGLFSETNSCGASLAAGASCGISITVSPVTTGSVTGTLLVTDNAAGSPQTVTLSGTGTAAPVPVASFSPASLSFSATEGTTSAPQTVTLSNTGKAPLNIIGIVAGSSTLAGLFNETSNCGASLAAGASCAVSITFSPVSTGSVAGTLLVTDNATGSPQPITLRGTGVAPPAPTFMPSALAFGNQVVTTTSAGLSTTLSNTGTGTLVIDGGLPTILGAGAASMSATSNCPATLGPAATCTVSVAFTPSSVGAYSLSLQMTAHYSSAPSIVFTPTVALTGTGIAQPPVLAISPATLDFGKLIVNTTSARLPVTVKNTSTTDTIALTTFVINSPGFSVNFASCPPPLAPGASCTVYYSFSPSAAQVYNAVASIQPVPYQCGGCVRNYPVGTFNLTGVGVLPMASLTPASMSFTSTASTTSAAQTATLTNTGAGSLTILGISVLGASPNDYSQTNNCGISLPVGANCIISVTFTPPAAGSYPATLTVSSNDAASPQTIALTGSGTTIPDFVIASSTMPQTILPGGSAQYSLTVTAQNGATIPAVKLTASGLPPGATAVFSHSSVTPGSTAATSTLSIETSTKTSVKMAGFASRAWPLAAPGLALAGLLFFPAKRRRRWATLGVLIVVSLSSLATLSGCGDSSLPPVKSYNVTITGTIGTVQQTCTVQLTVR